MFKYSAQLLSCPDPPLPGLTLRGRERRTGHQWRSHYYPHLALKIRDLIIRSKFVATNVLFIQFFFKTLGSKYRVFSVNVRSQGCLWVSMYERRMHRFQHFNLTTRNCIKFQSMPLTSSSLCRCVNQELGTNERLEWPILTNQKRVRWHLTLKISNLKISYEYNLFWIRTWGIVLKRPDLSILRNIDLHNKIYLKGTQNILVDEQWMSEKVLFLCSIQNLMLW